MEEKLENLFNYAEQKGKQMKQEKGIGMKENKIHIILLTIKHD